MFEVASFVIRGTGLPTFPKDTHPFEGERAQDDMVAFALGLHVLVVLLGPGGIDDGLAGPLDKGLAQKAWGMPAPVDPGLTTTARDDRGQSAVRLETPRVRIEGAIFAKGDEQPRLEGLAGTGQFPKEIGLAVLSEQGVALVLDQCRPYCICRCAPTGDIN